jgi:hypothetical protein
MKGDKSGMINCGTIFLLEKVMYNRLSHHMHTNNKLVLEQFGFRQRKSTDNAAFNLTVYWNLLYKKWKLGEYSVH